MPLETITSDHRRVGIDLHSQLASVVLAAIGGVEAVPGADGKDVRGCTASAKFRRAEGQHIDERREEKALSLRKTIGGRNDAFVDVLKEISPNLSFALFL